MFSPVSFNDYDSIFHFNKYLGLFMHIRVLGSGAGGGFPQWNCNCENCAGLRANNPNLTAKLNHLLL